MLIWKCATIFLLDLGSKVMKEVIYVRFSSQKRRGADAQPRTDEEANTVCPSQLPQDRHLHTGEQAAAHQRICEKHLPV